MSIKRLNPLMTILYIIHIIFRYVIFWHLTCLPLVNHYTNSIDLIVMYTQIQATVIIIMSNGAFRNNLNLLDQFAYKVKRIQMILFNTNIIKQLPMFLLVM